MSKKPKTVTTVVYDPNNLTHLRDHQTGLYSIVDKDTKEAIDEEKYSHLWIVENAIKQIQNKEIK